MPQKTRRSLQTSKGLRVLNLLYCIQSKGQIRSPGCENEEKNKGPVRVPQLEFTYVGPSFYHKVLSREENYDGDGIEFRSGNGVRDKKKNGASEECPNWQACRR